MNKSILRNSFILYTVFFILLLPIVFLPFLLEGKSFVWNIDGINQHYPILMHYGKMLCEVFTGKGFPMVDFQIGMGFDTITTLHYYVLGDPLTLLSVFMAQGNGVDLYNGLILLRFYLIGISYLIFCGYWGYRGHGRILGALIYVFCGYTFYSGVRHPFFLNPMIYLPLLLLGLEQVMQRKKPYLLIGMAFLCTISNFYFLYILTILSVVYVIFRYIVRFRKEYSNQFTGFILTGVRVGGYYLMGIALACVILLPVVYAFLQNGRMESKPELLTSYFYYNKDYYLSFLQGVFASGVSSGYWVNLAFPSITAVSVSVMLCNKVYSRLRIAFLLSIVVLLIPAFGYLMNAFSYVTNRWSFLISFLTAFLFTVTYKEIYQLRRWSKVLLVFGTAGYGILAFAFRNIREAKYSFMLLLITVLAVLLLQTKTFSARKRLQYVVLYLLVVTSLGFNGYAFYSGRFNGYAGEFLTKGEVLRRTAGAEASAIKEINDTGFYRIETYGDKVQNEALIIGYNDVSGYYSLMDGNVTNYLKQLELVSQRTAYRSDNLDNRTVLNALANVKYMVTTDKTAAPYAYKLINEIAGRKGTYYLYENLFALPLGYTYQSYMLEEDYNKLSALEKQNALMTCAVLERDSGYAAKTGQDMGVGIKKLNYVITDMEGVTYDKGKLHVLNKEAYMTLAFDNEKKSETYLRLVNTSMDAAAIAMQTIKVKGVKEVTKPVNIRSKYHNTYFGKTNYLTNTGYSKGKKNWIRLTFPNKGTFSCDAIEIYNMSMDYYRQQVKKLKQTALQNIEQRNNQLEGDVTLAENGIMLLSIPYSKGWRGYVDGHRVELLRGNVLYTAVELSEGAHHILLKYETPYIKLGLVISLSALLFVIGMTLFYEIHRKKYKFNEAADISKNTPKLH